MYLSFCWRVLLWPQTSTHNFPHSTECVWFNQHTKILFLKISERCLAMLMLSFRFRGSADGLRKQHAYGHARRHPRFHERIHVVSTGLGQRPDLPPPSRLCRQVRRQNFGLEFLTRPWSFTTNSKVCLQTSATAYMRSGSGGTDHLHRITQSPTPL